MSFQRRIYKPGDLADCYAGNFFTEDNRTTKFQVRLIEKIMDTPLASGQEMWYVTEPESNISEVPVDKSERDNLGIHEYFVVTNEDYLARLDEMAREGRSWWYRFENPDFAQMI